MKRKYLYLSGLLLLLIATTIIAVFLLKSNFPINTAIKWGIIVDIWTPENYIAHEEGGYTLPQIGTVSVILQKNSNVDPKQTLYDILDGGGRNGQYDVGTFISQENKNTTTIYNYILRSSPEFYYTQHGIPPIHQDNENINFCFYVCHGPMPVGRFTWWDSLNCDVISLTVILPEGYTLRSDVDEPSGWGREIRKDNNSSIFTTAPRLNKVFEDNRWRIEATWVMGEFDKFNAGLYLEIHYRRVS